MGPVTVVHVAEGKTAGLCDVGSYLLTPFALLQWCGGKKMV